MRLVLYRAHSFLFHTYHTNGRKKMFPFVLCSLIRTFVTYFNGITFYIHGYG